MHHLIKVILIGAILHVLETVRIVIVEPTSGFGICFSEKDFNNGKQFLLVVFEAIDEHAISFFRFIRGKEGERFQRWPAFCVKVHNRFLEFDPLNSGRAVVDGLANSGRIRI